MTTKTDIEKLFRSNYRAMYILAYRLLHDEDIARDIVHDVFASLLDGDASPVSRTWLMNGVRYACLNHIRNLSTRDRLNRLYALDLDDIEDEEWPDDESIALLHDIIDNRMTEQTRRIVKLRYGEHLKYQEIAEKLSISETAVYKHLRHAINVLRLNFKQK